jgi:hypothetical protein
LSVSPAVATPAETVNPRLSVYPSTLRRLERRTASRSFSATAKAAVFATPGRTIANWPDTRRAAMSVERSRAAISSPTAFRMRSPAACPRTSFTTSNASISSSNSDSGVP